MSPLISTFSGDSARAEGMLTNTTTIANNYWLFTSTDNSGSYGTGNNYIGLDTYGNVLLTGNNNAAYALVYSLNSLSGTLNYARYLIDPNSSHLCISYAAAGDNYGNAYFAGLQKTPAGYQASFVAKYNSLGNIQWQKTWADNAGGNNASRFNRLTVDQSGNVIANGSFYNSLTIQSPSLVKYDTNGVLQWSYLISTTTSASGYNYSGPGGVTTDSSGNIYTSGFFPNGSSSFGTGFVAKVSSSGTLQWATQLVDASSTSGVYPQSITTDSSNNVYVVGCANNASNKEVAFLMKLNSSGTLQWQRFLADAYTPGSASGYQTQLNAVSLDSSGNIYVMGNGLNSLGYTVGFLAKYNNSGTIQWQRTITNDSYAAGGCYFDAGGLDRQGNIIAGGSITSSTGAGNALVMKLPSDGSLQGVYSNSQVTVAYVSSSWTDSAGTITSSSGNVVLNPAIGSVDSVGNLNDIAGAQNTATSIVNTSVVTSGLVLYWDFGNPNSYPGTGTTVYDLSGSGNNGTINGTGGKWSSANGGIYTFSGTNTITSSGPNLSSSNYTVMGAAKYNGSNARIISCLNNNWLLGQWSNNTYQYYAEGWVAGPGGHSPNTDNDWHIWTGTGRTNYLLYEGTTLVVSGTSGSQGPNGWAINSYANSSEYSNGSIGFLLCYNRTLTSGEIVQNNSYFASRYPKLVTSGIITHLDAGNTLSYPTTGTTWTDISPSGYNYNVTASTFVSSGPQYFNFGSTGMASSVNQTNPAAPAAYTIMVWTRVLNSTADWRTLYRPYTNYHTVIFQQGAYNLGMYNNVSGGYLDSGYLQTSLPNYGTSNWVCLFFQINNSTSPYWTMSYNDTPGIIRAQITDSRAYTPYMLGWLGGINGSLTTGAGGSQFWGDIAHFTFYNRTLSTAEMLQNFNATRARFSM